jgi:M6 family metalloprotease-like protein
MRLSSRLVKLSLTVLLCLLSGTVFASMVRSMPMKVTQPDGTVLELLASGDEFHNWLHDKDNYTIIQHPLTGYYCYAVKDGNGVQASDLIVGHGSPEMLGIPTGVNISPELYKQMRRERFAMPAERDAPTTGTINNLVVFIRFSDETEFGDLLSLHSGRFNTDTNSLKNYYLEASYSQLTVNTTFYPVTGNNYVLSWQDSHPRAYYQPYNATTNPTGYNGDTERRTREFTLLQNATNGVSSQIPSSLTIDSDNDGRVDNVVYIVKGAAGAWASLLWPHRWSLYDRYVYINSKRVYDFNFQLQTFLSSRGVGVLCHEFFHTLGAPDLYHYTDNGIDPAGSWDIMESDQNPPQHMTAFMKYKYGDWIPSIPTITADQAYTLNPLTFPTGNCYRINSNNSNQYYVVEFRKKTGTFESSIPNSGMLIYRIDTSCGNGNADGPPDELYIYRPNGTTTTNGTLSSAHFSSESGRVKIDNTTNPTPFLQDGSAGNLYLCEIGSSAGATITFRKGAPSVDFTINPYSQGFEATSFPPDGWTKQAVTGTYEFTRVTSGTNPSCSPQAGAGMLRYNSDVAPVGNSAIIVSPKIVCTDPTGYGYQLSFWMYRDGNQSTALDKIDVYVNTSANLTGSPILLGTIHRARQQSPTVSSPGWKQYFFALPFSASGSYYAVLHAVSASGYNMYLDSVKIAKVPLPVVSPVPNNLASEVHFAQALSWQNGGGNPTGYKLYLGTDNPPTNVYNGLDLGNSLSFTPYSDWLLGSTYYWSVAPYNEGGMANNNPVMSFTVMDVTPVFPVSVDFGTTGAVFPPDNWTKHSGALADPTALDASGTGNWFQDDYHNLVTNPRDYAARINIYGTNRNGWLISPLMNIPAGSILQFDLALTDYGNSNAISTDPNGLTGSDDRFAVLIGNGYTWSSANVLRQWDNAGSSFVYNQIPHTGQSVYLDLTGHTGKKYIAFYGESLVSNADNDLFVDNVQVRVASTAPGIELSQTSWNAEEALINSSVSQPFTLYNTGLANLRIDSVLATGSSAFTVAGLPSMPVTLGFGQSLSFTTIFNPAIAGECSAVITISGNAAQTSIPLSGIGFDARIASVPYTQNFDAKSSPQLPLGWTPIVASSSPSAHVQTSTSNPTSYPNSLYITNSTDAAADLRLVSPELLLPLDTVRLRFYARGGSSGYTLLVGTMASPDAGFQQFAEITLTDTQTQYTVSFAGYSGTNRYIAFKHGLGGTSRSIYIDDLLLEALLEADLKLSSIQGPRFAFADETLEYTVSVTNNGIQTQSGYDVRLLASDGRDILATLHVVDPLAPETTAVHTLGWTGTDPSEFVVTADVVIPNDGCLVNDVSEPAPLSIYPAEAYAPVVGDADTASTTNTMPFDFFYKNSVSETIFLAGDLQMTAGNVTAIAFVNNFVQNLPQQPVRIWMKNTTETDLSTAWLPFDGYTLVYEGFMDFPKGINTILFQFQTPFPYSGQNLAIRCNRPMDLIYYNTANHFYYNADTVYPNRTRYIYSDSTVYDPTAPSGTGTPSSNVPLTSFIVLQASPLELQTPVLELSIDGPTPILTWDIHPGYYGYDIYSTTDHSAWSSTPDATVYEAFYTPADAARKFFRIVAFSYPYDIRSVRDKLAEQHRKSPSFSDSDAGFVGHQNKDR